MLSVDQGVRAPAPMASLRFPSSEEVLDLLGLGSAKPTLAM